MKVMAQPFYRPLDSSGREIRLMRYRILPGTDEIHGTLQTVSLNQKRLLRTSIRYAAVSYVWNAIPGTEQIHIEGHPLDVTRNLTAFLRIHWQKRRSKPWNRALRLPLWIDAVCIDQGDTTEKSKQVTMMGQIFESAQVTFAWLGPSSEKLDRAMHALKYLATRASLAVRLSSIRIFPTRIMLERYVRYLSNSSFDNAIYETMGLLNGLYFKRTWILQELVLSRSVVLLQGVVELPLKEVLALEEYVMEQGPAAGSRYDSEGLWATLFLIVSSLDTLKTIIQFRELLSSHQNEARALLTGKYAYELFASTVNYAATIPVDRIYGLLGLLRLPILPDYTSATTDVFQDFAAHIVNDGGLPTILRCSGQDLQLYRTQIRKMSSLPSWVPEWETSWPPMQSYTSSASLTSSSRVSQGRLQLQGHRCCVISAATGLLGTDWPRRLQGIYSRMSPKYRSGVPKLQMLIATLASSPRYIQPGVDCIEVVLRVFTWWLRDTAENGVPVHNSLSLFGFNQPMGSAAPGYIGWFTDNTNIDRCQAKSLSYSSSFNDVMEGVRREEALSIITGILELVNFQRHALAIFDNGFIGLGPPSMAPEDIVCAFPGCDTYYILRKQEDVYVYLGPCFVIGMEHLIDFD